MTGRVRKAKYLDNALRSLMEMKCSAGELFLAAKRNVSDSFFRCTTRFQKAQLGSKID